RSDRGRAVLITARAVDYNFGNHQIADTDARSHAAGNPDHHDVIEFAESEETFGGARRERGADTRGGRDNISVADLAGVNGHPADLSRLQPERPHDRTQLRLHRREHADSHPISSGHRASLPETRDVRPLGRTARDRRLARVSRTLNAR